jgi:hypothetical protein
MLAAIPSKNIICIGWHQLNFKPVKSCAASELFNVSNVGSRSNAFLSGRTAVSAPNLETFFSLESLRRIPGFVISLVHPSIDDPVFEDRFQVNNSSELKSV